MKCLIADDEITNRFMLLNLMSKYFYCDVAVNGREAFEAFERAHQEGKPYDLICLDVIMPEMDGHQVLMLIREMERSLGLKAEQMAKVIVMSAFVESEEVNDVFENTEYNAYMGKPITKQDYLKQIEKFGLI